MGKIWTFFQTATPVNALQVCVITVLSAVLLEKKTPLSKWVGSISCGCSLYYNLNELLRPFMFLVGIDQDGESTDPKSFEGSEDSR